METYVTETTANERITTTTLCIHIYVGKYTFYYICEHPEQRRQCVNTHY